MLTNKDKLFSKYINIPSNQCLKDIIVRFENLIGISNICGTIDEIHILLKNLRRKRITFVVVDFFNRKKFNSIVL